MVNRNHVHQWMGGVRAGLLVAFGSTSIAATTRPSLDAAGHTPFSEIVASHFQDWDQNKDGILESPELDHLIADSSVTGDEAVALAVIKIVVHRREHLKVQAPPLTMDYFHRYESEGWFNHHPPADADQPVALSSPGTTATTAPAIQATSLEKTALLEPNFDRSFRMLKVKLGRVKYALFTAATPSQDQIHQGSMGDCFYLSSVGAMVARDPSLLQKMIVPEGSAADGNVRYCVNFPGSHSVTVSAPTDGELAIGAGSAGNGLWLPILEKAFGALMNQTMPADERSEELLDVIDHGGDPNVAIQYLTGHSTDPTPALHEHTQTADAFLSGFRQKLSKALAEHRLVIVSLPTERVPPGMMPQHSYAATGYDLQTDHIQIWNPIGLDFTPKGPEGIANGYSTTHGHFSMSMTDFYSLYRSAVFETGEPATSPAATQPVQAAARSL